MQRLKVHGFESFQFVESYIQVRTWMEISLSILMFESYKTISVDRMVYISYAEQNILYLPYLQETKLCNTGFLIKKCFKRGREAKDKRPLFFFKTITPLIL